MQATTVKGYYGSQRTPCKVYCAYGERGTWYVVHGSVNVNLTPDPIEDGVNVELLTDIDMFTWPDGVYSEGGLIKAIEA